MKEERGAREREKQREREREREREKEREKRESKNGRFWGEMRSLRRAGFNSSLSPVSSRLLGAEISLVRLRAEEEVPEKL